MSSKLSSLEGAVLVACAIIPWAVLFIPVIVIGIAERDAWVTPFLPAAPALGAALLFNSLGRRFPGLTPLAYACLIAGRPLGALIGAGYILWFLVVASAALRGFAELILTALLSFTPISAVIGATLAVSAYAVRQGIVVLARLSLIILFGFTLTMALIFLLSATDFDARNLQPILAGEWLPIYQSGFVASGFFTEVAVAGFIVLPALRQPGRALAAMAWPVCFIAVMMSLSSLWYLGLFGSELAANFPFVSVNLARFVEIADFLLGMEILFVGAWIGMSFAKVSIWFYAAAQSAAELLRLSDLSVPTLPLALAIGGLSLLLFENQIDFYEFIRTATPFMWIFTLAIPFGLWLLVRIREGLGSAPWRDGDAP